MKRGINLFIVMFFWLWPICILAQETPVWQHHLVFESELLLPNATLRDDISIRQNPMGDSWASYDEGTVSFSSGGLMLGTRFKLHNTPSNFGLSLGIRSKFIFTEIIGNSAKNSDFFYLRYYSNYENQVTKFARVNEVDEYLFILTFPLEAHYTFWKNELFDAFLSIGLEGGYVVARDLEITFRNETIMDLYEGAVKASLEHTTSDIYGATYGSAGIMLGNSRQFVFELCIPGIFFSNNYFKLGTANTYIGLRFSLQVPLFKSQKP